MNTRVVRSVGTRCVRQPIEPLLYSSTLKLLATSLRRPGLGGRWLLSPILGGLGNLRVLRGSPGLLCWLLIPSLLRSLLLIPALLCWLLAPFLLRSLRGLLSVPGLLRGLLAPTLLGSLRGLLSVPALLRGLLA